MSKNTDTATTPRQQSLIYPPDSDKTTCYDSPPDGGKLAWLQILGSFFLFFNSWGIANTFGVFQTYYGLALLKHESPSDVSWIGSIQTFLLLLLGVISGPLYDAGYFRALVITGTVLNVIGFMLTSICTEYWQVLLAQAFLIGLGSGCLYVPSVAIIPQYFSSNKALATGIAASGSSLGGMIYAIVFRQLQPQIGFPWATRTLGFICLGTCLISLSVMRVRETPKTKRPLLELKAFTEIPYVLFCSAMFTSYLGFFTPIFYIQTYAIQTTTMNDNLAFYLVAILNAASIPGRIVPAFIAGKTGPLNMLLPAAAITGILSLCWIAIHDTPGLISFAILYGIASGAFVALPAVTLASLTPDFRTLGTRIGMCSMINSFGSLCGTPIAGAILNATDGFLGVQLFSGVIVTVTGVLLLITRYAIVGRKLCVKV